MTKEQSPKPKVVSSIVPATDKLHEKVFKYFKSFIAAAEFGNALREFITPRKVPGILQSFVVNPQIINVAYSRETWTEEEPQASDWVVTEKGKLPIGLFVDESKIFTYAPFALPTMLPKRVFWIVEFMPVDFDGKESEEKPSAALRFRYRCGADNWTELVSEPIELKNEPVRFGFDVPPKTYQMGSLFECLMGVTPMTDTPVIVRAAWLTIVAFE